METINNKIYFESDAEFLRISAVGEETEGTAKAWIEESYNE